MQIATIIIPHHDRKDHLERLLNTIQDVSFEVIVESGGTFAENCNRGAKKALTDKLIFCNDDCTPTVQDLRKLVYELYDYDIVGATQTYEGGKIWGIGFNGSVAEIKHTSGCSVVPSGFLFGICKSHFDYFGGFNEEFKNGYEDADLFMKALIYGLKIKILDLEVFHFMSQSAGRMDRENDNRRLFYEIYSKETLQFLNENTDCCI